MQEGTGKTWVINRGAQRPSVDIPKSVTSTLSTFTERYNFTDTSNIIISTLGNTMYKISMNVMFVCQFSIHKMVFTIEVDAETGKTTEPVTEPKHIFRQGGWYEIGDMTELEIAQEHGDMKWFRIVLVADMKKLSEKNSQLEKRVKELEKPT